MSVDAELFATEYMSDISKQPGPYLNLFTDNYVDIINIHVVEYLYDLIQQRYNSVHNRSVNDDMMTAIINFNLYRISIYLQKNYRRFDCYDLVHTVDEIIDKYIGLDLNPFEDKPY